MAAKIQNYNEGITRDATTTSTWSLVDDDANGRGGCAAAAKEAERNPGHLPFLDRHNAQRRDQERGDRDDDAVAIGGKAAVA